MWVRFQNGVSKHPKTKVLADKLGISLYGAGGILAFLWSWAVKNAEMDGNISAFRDRHIERVCCWDGKTGELVPALQSSGFLDGDYDDDSLRIHDWLENGGASLQQSREKATERQRRMRERNKSHETVTRDNHCDGHATKSQSQNKSQSIDVESDTERNPFRNPFVIQDNKKSAVSATSTTSGDARGLYGYFKAAFPDGETPEFNTFKDLLAQGFEEDTIKRMIDMTAAGGAEQPARYFTTVCKDKANRGLFTLAALEADEAEFERQKRPYVPPAIYEEIASNPFK